jgi:HEPN domain-containing protein
MLTETTAGAQTLLENALDDHRREHYHFAAGEFGRACFFCRHSAEKLFKAFLAGNGAKPPKQHSLKRLVDRCAKHEPLLQGFREAARHLDQYFIGAIPDERLMKRPYTGEEAGLALTLVGHMIDVTRPLIVKQLEEMP